MNCERILERLEAYAIGGLERSERRHVESHIAGCSNCRAVLDGYLEAAALLLEAPAAPGLRAPAALRAKVLTEAAGGGAGASLPALATRVRPNVAAMALVLILLALSLAWALRQTSALARERSLRTDLEQFIGQQEIVLEVVDSPRTTKAVLRAVEPGSTAYGKLYTRADLTHVVALVGRVPPPPDGFVYNLWVARAGVEQLAGPMPVNEKGFALILFDADREGPTYDGARVVRQPTDSTSPDGAVIVRWDAPR